MSARNILATPANVRLKLNSLVLRLFSGVIHVVDHLLLPTNDLNLSVEKYLLALNASRFVGLMHQAGLASYIDRAPHPGDDETPAQEPFTVLAPRDDVIDEWLAPHEAKNAGWGRRGNKDDAPPMGEEDLKELLKYHLVPGQFKPSNLSDGMLIGTELVSGPTCAVSVG